jgi:uridine kinase
MDSRGFMRKPFVIGLAGGSGSGKSTLAAKLISGSERAQVALLNHDSYYLDGGQMPPLLRAEGNWDHPDALDNSLFIEHVDALLAGRRVAPPLYDFSTHRRCGAAQPVEPGPVLLLEGVLLFAVPAIRDRIDLRVFVDAPAEERVVRRVLRDTAERGRTIESVIDQLRTTVVPMHDQLVEPSKSFAHVIIPWGWNVDHQPAIELLLSRIRQAAARQGG